MGAALSMIGSSFSSATPSSRTYQKCTREHDRFLEWAHTLGVVLVVLLLRGWLYGVPPFDPIALGGAVAILMGCATVALLIPVRRATRVDPMAALRAE
jgi:ABC-type antimicrobial peptide transport system permease subunit